MNTVELNVPIYELKIESGIGGGSISLVKNKLRVDEWIGHSIADRNDKLIESLSELLKRNDVRISQISKITYSVYPASQTGLRIINSIIKGLRAAHNIDAVGKNLFGSIAEFYSADQQIKTIIVLPVKSNTFEFAKYSCKTKIEEGRFVTFNELNSAFNSLNKNDSVIVIPFKMLGESELEIVKNIKNSTSIKLTDSGENLSIYL